MQKITETLNVLSFFVFKCIVEHYQTEFRRKYKCLTTNYAVFVKFGQRLSVIFINYRKPPERQRDMYFVK